MPVYNLLITCLTKRQTAIECNQYLDHCKTGICSAVSLSQWGKSTGLVERPKTINNNGRQKGKMKKSVLLVAAMAITLSVGYADQVVSKNKKPAKPAGATGAVKGIIEIGPKLSPQEVAAKIAKGKTTLDEVLSLLGPTMPNVIMHNDSTRTVVCSWRKEIEGWEEGVGKMAANTAIGQIPFVGMGWNMAKHKAAKERLKEQVAAIKDSRRSLTLLFDASGVLKDFQFNPPFLAEAPSPSLTAVTPSR